jgi:hypothetical protein
MGEVLSLRRERCVSMTGYYRDPVPAPVPFWLKPVSIFGLLLITTFIEPKLPRATKQQLFVT